MFGGIGQPYRDSRLVRCDRCNGLRDPDIEHVCAMTLPPYTGQRAICEYAVTDDTMTPAEFHDSVLDDLALLPVLGQERSTSDLRGRMADEWLGLIADLPETPERS